MYRILLGLAMLSFGTAAVADTAGEGFFFAPTLLYYDIEYEEGDSEAEETRTDLDISLGYSFGNLMLGGKYYNSEIDTGSNEVNSTAIGAVIGFEHKAFKLLGSYNFVNVEKEYDEPDLKYSDGTGIIIEMMYIVEFGNWGFGPKLFYKNFTYDEQTLNGQKVEGFDGRDEKEIFPFLAFYFKV